MHSEDAIRYNIFASELQVLLKGEHRVADIYCLFRET